MNQDTQNTRLLFRTLYTLCIFLSASLPSALCQQVIVNSNGDKIIMYPDGSWRPVEPRDSLLLKQSFHKAEPILDPDLTNGSSPGNKAEEQNILIRQAQDLKQKLMNQEKKVQNEFRNATNAQFKAAEMLRNAEANENVIEEQRMEALRIAYEGSIKNLRHAKLNQKAIKKLLANVLVLANNPSSIKRSKLEQLKSKYNIYLANFENIIPPKEIEAPPIQKETRTHNRDEQTTASVEKEERIIATKENINESILVNPVNRPSTYASEPYKCEVKVDTIDIDSRRIQIEVIPSVIFTHTDADLRPYFKDKELITCKGSMLKIGPYYYLTVQFQIGSSYSQNNFGALQKESLFRLKLLNGEYISLYNIKSDRGHIDPYTGHTVFTGQYALGKDEIRRLKEAPLDKIRVLWATGFEDYDVYNIDFFTDQIGCLEAQ